MAKAKPTSSKAARLFGFGASLGGALAATWYAGGLLGEDVAIAGLGHASTTLFGSALCFAGLSVWTARAERRATARAKTFRPTRIPARYDPLTGVRNRASLLEFMTDPAIPHGADDETTVIVVVIDPDRLRTLNALHGRGAGDQVLSTIAERLRAVAEPSGTIGRLAGAEFGCIVQHTAGADRAIRMVAGMLSAVGDPIEVRGGTVSLHAAIGIAGGRRRERSSGRTLASARAAAAGSRRPGVSTCAVYDAAQDEAARNRSTLEVELRDGLTRGEFLPFYEPTVCPRTGTITGFACVATWHHPRRGLLNADAFVDAARNSGMLRAIGLTLLHRACADADRWPRHQGLSFDAATLKLDDPRLAESVLRTLLATGLAPRRLSLTVPRTATIGNRAALRAALLALSDAGVQILLDDIGLDQAQAAAAFEPQPVRAIGRPAGWRRPAANDYAPFRARARG